ncbi:MAG: HD-GYP domain-containing protein [Eubacteriales bacterium]|nr:HD-GYP domain-containing protein [Eubacteriales bacterium]
MSEIPQKTKNFIFSLGLTAISFLAVIVFYFDVENWGMVALFSLFTIIAETFLVQIPGVGAISVSFAITLAAIILGGPLSAIIVSVCGILFSRPYVEGRGNVHIFNTPIYKTTFNVAQNILYTGLAALAYLLLHSRFYFLGELDPVSITGSIMTFLLVNTLIMTFLIITLSGGKFFYIWSDNFRGTIVNVMAVGLLGVIVALAYDNYGAGAVVLFFVPLMLSRYSFKLYVDMRKNYYDTVKALINAIEAKDPYTSGHANRVGEYSVAIAQEINLSAKQIEIIKNAALLHDIGKIGIDDRILNKQERLSDLELEVIKNHPSIGYDIIKDIGFLKDVMNIVKHHHEKWDGSGYPQGLKGSEIPIETTILTISDAYDAMTTDRPYRKALSSEEAIMELRKHTGTQFNPEIIDKAIETLRKIDNHSIDSIQNTIEGIA